MLLGVGPEVHKLTNGIVSSTPYPVDSAFPSLFRRIREVMPDAELGSYCDWNPITFGIVENNQNVANATAHDTDLMPMICDYIREKKPTFLFTQLDSVDGAGHGHGYGSEAHLRRIHEVDELMNDAYEAVKEAGILEDTLFIMIADHGGFGTGHGGWTDEEKYVTFAAAGKGVQKGTIEEMNIRDLSAIVLYALGIDAPAFDEQGWTAQVPAGIFADAVLPEYRDISHLTGAAPRRSKVAHTSELI
jgi:predicted AlkP superfamily pyrophosphatase or phosphodiesterase